MMLGRGGGVAVLKVFDLKVFAIFSTNLKERE